MSKYIFYDSGVLIKDTANTINLWNGLFSVAAIEGSIITFISNYIKGKENALFISLVRDGDTMFKEVDDIINENRYTNTTKKIIVGTLAQRLEDRDVKYLYMPLDDNFFTNGVNYYFRDIPPWESRKPMAYWRGGASGGGLESARCRTVEKLINCPHADVKYTRGGWETGKNIPEHFFVSERVHHRVFLDYKIFLIIDGNCIASSHMWGFGSGGVPFIISNANCWFMKFLTPFVNYIPIKYDLTDLIEQIEWVVHNDSEAKKIANAARDFSEKFFSSDFQKKYLMNEIDRFLSE